MKNYVICTDSACDIKPADLEQWGVEYCSLTFQFDDSKTAYSNNEMNVTEFYNRMRAGGIAKTSAINADTFEKAFEKHLAQGKDVLYLGFSSGLSATFNSARLAAEALREKYPDGKILVVDTLAASAGFGMLVYLTAKERDKGATIEEAAAFAEATKLHICHWFTVDDLEYLKRGGRVSPAVAFFGNKLGIKPVLHVDNEGHLINVTKVRGRKNAIAALAKALGDTALDAAGGTVFISHGDCQTDVDHLAEILQKNYNAKVDLVTDVGPVIGAHSGPGTLALFFVGKER